MGRIEKYPSRNRHFKIPICEGDFSERYILNQIDIANERTPSKYSTGEPCGKPGTMPDAFAVKTYLKMIEGSNPNNVDGHMFLGSYELGKEAIDMTANLLGIDLKKNLNFSEGNAFILFGNFYLEKYLTCLEKDILNLDKEKKFILVLVLLWRIF